VGVGAYHRRDIHCWYRWSATAHVGTKLAKSCGEGYCISMRGRKPLAPELKVLQGVRRDRINARAPTPSDGVPTPPRSLSPPQRAIFRQVVAELTAMRVRCTPDVLIIEALAGMVGWNRRASAELERVGAWGPGARGGVVTTPAWRVFRDSNHEIARLSAELGLSPTARNRLVTGPEPASALEALLT
jgi:P27 family predicted phage terminase small subunit